MDPDSPDSGPAPRAPRDRPSGASEGALRGRALAASITAEAAARAAAFEAAAGRKATVAVIGWSTDPTTGPFLATKERAFRGAGLGFRGVILDPGRGSAAAVDAARRVVREPGVDGMLIQYPIPPGIGARAILDAVPPELDIDGGRRDALGRLGTGGRGGAGLGAGLEAGGRADARAFPSATASAVLRVLEAHGVAIRGVPAVVVTGEPAIAAPVSALLERAGAGVERVTAGPVPAGARLVVVAAGRPGAVRGAWLPDGSVVVDTGYYHGGGRGDVAWGDARSRLGAWVPAVGGVGPVTVALLIARTVTTAETRRARPDRPEGDG